MGGREGASRPVAVVTGASQGLGLAVAEALARDGWRLVIDALPAHRAMLAGAAADLGPVGLVVNNASTLGASPLPSLSDIEAAVLQRIFDVNVIAPFSLLQALGPSVAPGATVVN